MHELYGEISSMVEREFVALDISVQFWYLTPNVLIVQWIEHGPSKSMI